MPSPRKRKQRKVLLREQEREEVESVLPVEEDVKPASKKERKTVKEVFSSILEEDSDTEDSKDKKKSK